MKKAKRLTARVGDTIHRHQMFTQEDSVLVGVSGGADSVCLVHVLRELGFDLVVAHLNHGWRGDASEEDARFVEALAGRLDLPFFGSRAKCDPREGNAEAIAREARKQFFDEVLKREGLTKIALAHSRDDRTETFLLHLFRGSGATGLTSMRATSEPVVRPLIESTREEIEVHLQEIGETWREDATNQDPRFARNRVRHLVLPTLTSEFNPRLQETLSRTIDILTAEDEWMNRRAEEWLESRSSMNGFAFEVEVGGLAAEPLAFVRRVLRASLRAAGSTMHDIGFEHIEKVRSLLEPGKSGRIIELPGVLSAERSFNTLVFRPDEAEPEEYEYELPIPGQVHVPEIGRIFEARFRSPNSLKPKEEGVFVDGESLGPYVKIRNWRNGDVYNPAGLGVSKLKKLFQKERIPRRQRRQWPVVVAESSIIWVASFPVSRDFVPTGRSRRIVEFEASPSI